MFCNLNVQIYVRVGEGVFGVGRFDVWLRKLHVEWKQWEGAVNKIKKKKFISRKRYIFPLQIPQL